MLCSPESFTPGSEHGCAGDSPRPSARTVQDGSCTGRGKNLLETPCRLAHYPALALLRFRRLAVPIGRPGATVVVSDRLGIQLTFYLFKET